MSDCDLAELRYELQIGERTFAFGSVVDSTLAVRKLPLDPGGRVRSENRNLNRSTFGTGEQVSFFRGRFHEGGKSIAEGMASLNVAEVERVGGNQLSIFADRLGAILYVPAAGDGNQEVRCIVERDLGNGQSAASSCAKLGDGKVSVMLDNGPFRNSGDFRDFRDKLFRRGHVVLDADADQPLPQFSNAQNGKEIDRPPLLSIVQNANDSEEGETMTEIIKIDRDKLVDAFAQFLAEVEPVPPGADVIDVRSITRLAEKGRELAAAGAFRNKTIYSETVERLDREGYTEAEVIAISEIGLQVGRAVNAAFMNAAGVYSGTAKLLRAFEKEIEGASEQTAIQPDVAVPPYDDVAVDEIMAHSGLVWDELIGEYAPDDLKGRPDATAATADMMH